MRRAIGVAMALLFSLPLWAGSITSISPSSIQVASGEYFMDVAGSGFSDTDTFIIDGNAGHFEVDVNAIDKFGTVTGWIPQEVVNKSGTYTLSVRSPSGTSDKVNFVVFKPGRLPLQIHLPEAITVLARSRLGTSIKYDISISGGDESSVDVKCDPESGSDFPFGQSKITCTATNLSGERDSSTILVNVFDGESPKLYLPASFEAAADDEKGAYVKYDAGAEDAIDGSVRVTCDRESGSLFPNGNTRVNCEAVDAALNPAYGNFTVFVKPRDPGTLSLKVSDVRTPATDKEGAYVTYEAIPYGSADPDPVVTCYPESGDFFRIGDTKVGCTASDDFGNRAEATFVVTVYDGNFLRAEDVTAEATSPNGADVSFDVRPDDQWTAAIVCSPESGSLFGFGETSVECNSTNADGGKVSGKFKVTVADTTAPHIENVRAVVGTLDSERHAMPVNIEVETIDAGDANPRCSVVSLTSDTAVEWQATSALSLELRGESARPNAFRVQVSCVDASGNTTTTNIPVFLTKGKVAKIQ